MLTLEVVLIYCIYSRLVNMQMQYMIECGRIASEAQLEVPLNLAILLLSVRLKSSRIVHHSLSSPAMMKNHVVWHGLFA